MKISAARADAFVKKPGDGVWAVLVYGPDRGLVRERADGLVAAFGVDVADPFALASLTEDGLKGEPSRLEDEARAMTLTGATRAVRLAITGETCAKSLVGLVEGLEGQAFAPSARVIVEAGALPPKSKIRKAFEAAKSAAAALPCYVDDAAGLARLVDDAAGAHGFSLTDEARARLIPRLEGDRAMARAELEKLALFAHGRGEPVSGVEIDDLIVGAEPGDVGLVADATLSGDAAAADSAYWRALAVGATPVGVMLAIQRGVMRLDGLRAQMAQGASVDDALSKARPPVFGPRRQTLKAQLRAWTGPKLDDAMDKLVAAERALKAGGAADEALCGRLILALAMAARRR